MEEKTREALNALGNARYISLATYKKNGAEVRTPVWVMRQDDHLVVWTDGKSYKVKRLRRNPELQVAECNASGKRILGPWHKGTAQIIEDPERIAGVRRALKSKYGWQVTLVDFVLWIRRQKQSDAVVLELSL